MNPALLALILTQAQVNWLNVSYSIGSKQNVGYTLAAIVWEESSFCERKRNRWSVGCMGTKRSTVRKLFDPAATRARLESDNDYSIRAGLSILLYCREQTKTWRAMVYCYHQGLPRTNKASDLDIQTDGYVNAIENKVKQLQNIPVDSQ